MRTIDRDITGRCLCGAVQFQSKVSSTISECHCSQCRKQSGYRYATVYGLKSDLEIEDEADLTWFRASDSAERGFCGICGSTLFWRSLKDDEAAILVGAIDDTEGMTLSRHIFVDDKADYVILNDGLPHE